MQEDWGELNTGKKAPALFVLNIPGGKVTAVSDLPEDSSTGQPVWTPDGKGDSLSTQAIFCMSQISAKCKIL